MTEGITAEFRSMVGEAQEAIDSTEFFSKWSPPGSDSGSPYACLLKTVKTGASEAKSGGTFAWVNVGFEILDGEFAGREFKCYFSAQYPGLTSELFNLASMLSSDPAHVRTKQLLPAVEAILPFAGEATVEVLRKNWYSPKTGKEGCSSEFTRVLDVAV